MLSHLLFKSVSYRKIPVGRRGLQHINLVSQHSVEEIEQTIRILKKRFPNKVVIPSIIASTKEDWQSLFVG